MGNTEEMAARGDQLRTDRYGSRAGDGYADCSDGEDEDNSSARI